VQSDDSSSISEPIEPGLHNETDGQAAGGTDDAEAKEVPSGRVAAKSPKRAAAGSIRAQTLKRASEGECRAQTT